MRWSLRARLTAWYSLVMIAVLVTSVVAVAAVQDRLALGRFDGELNRLLLTLEGVMRTEFGEGLTMDASAAEASVEVVAPDRTLVLTRVDGSLLAMWGQPFPRDWRPVLTQPTIATIVTEGRRLRMMSRPVTHGDHRYVAAAIAPLATHESEHAEMLTALGIGMLGALLVAMVGGWVIGRQALRPLAAMADQATAITERSLGGRLTTPSSGDELGRLATAFNGLLDRLAVVLHSQRQFMADASHELRTPVSVVRTTAQVMLSRDQRSEPEYRESLTIVAEQSARLTHLVNALFLLSRVEAEGLPLNPVPLYLDDVIDECARARRVFASQRGVTVETFATAEIAFVGDDSLLRQLVGNLLDNAIRHARPDGRVTAAVTATGAEIAITVSDDGHGIPPGQRERIFERFVRLEPLSAGAGLGLPIARWIAEAHGGRLLLDHSSPEGTCFRITLPLR